MRWYGGFENRDSFCFYPVKFLRGKNFPGNGFARTPSCNNCFALFTRTHILLQVRQHRLESIDLVHSVCSENFGKRKQEFASYVLIKVDSNKGQNVYGTCWKLDVCWGGTGMGRGVVLFAECWCCVAMATAPVVGGERERLVRVVMEIACVLMLPVVQVMDLEAKLADMQKEIGEGGASRKTRSSTDWIPRPPAK